MCCNELPSNTQVDDQHLNAAAIVRAAPTHLTETNPSGPTQKFAADTIRAGSRYS